MAESTKGTRLVALDKGGAKHHVKAYGAVGDGVANDNAAVQAAETAGGGDHIVWFGPGTYFLSSAAISLNAGSVWAAEPGTVTIKFPSGERRLNLADRTTLSGLIFEGSDDASANTNSYAIKAELCDRVRVQNCRFQNFGNDPIAFTGCSDVWVESSEFIDTRQADGIIDLVFGEDDTLGTTPSTRLVVRNCTFINSDKASNGCGGISFITDQGSGIYNRHILVEGCYFENMGRAESEAAPRAPIDVYRNAREIRIIGNNFLNSAGTDIKLRDVQKAQVIGNIGTGGDYNGVLVSHRDADQIIEDIIVQGNTFDTYVQRGIRIEGTDDANRPLNYAKRITVSGNHLVSTTLQAIRIQQAVGVRVMGNIVQDPGNVGIALVNSGFTDSPKYTVIGNHVDMGGQASIGIQAVPRENNPTTIVAHNFVEDNSTAAAIDVGGTTNARVDGNQFRSVGSKYTTATRTLINGVGEESANAETPTAANWFPGDIVDFTDTGDASGDGQYLLLQDGTTWAQIA